MRMPVGNWRWRIKCPLSCRDASDNAFAAVNVNQTAMRLWRHRIKRRSRIPVGSRGVYTLHFLRSLQQAISAACENCTALLFNANPYPQRIMHWRDTASYKHYKAWRSYLRTLLIASANGYSRGAIEKKQRDEGKIGRQTTRDYILTVNRLNFLTRKVSG